MSNVCTFKEFRKLFRNSLCVHNRCFLIEHTINFYEIGSSIGDVPSIPTCASRSRFFVSNNATQRSSFITFNANQINLVILNSNCFLQKCRDICDGVDADSILFLTCLFVNVDNSCCHSCILTFIFSMCYLS